MKKTKAEIISDLKAFIGENNSDEAIALIENVSDSIEENTDNEYNKEKYEELDRKWRQRYIDRFNNEEKEEDKDIIDVNDSNDDKPLTFENLFEEG